MLDNNTNYYNKNSKKFSFFQTKSTTIMKRIEAQAEDKQEKRVKMSPEQLYTALITQWINYQPNIQPINLQSTTNSQNIKKLNVNQQYFYQHFMPSLQSLTSLNLLFDKCAYKAIIRMLKTQPYIRISSKNEHNNNNSKNGNKYQHQDGNGLQPLNKLIEISQQLCNKKFISARMLKSIIEFSSCDNSIQAKIERILLHFPNLQQKMKQYQSQKNYQKWTILASNQTLQQLWQQHMPQFNIYHTWQNIILQPNNTITNNSSNNNIQQIGRQTVLKLYFLYKKYLSQKQYQPILFKLMLQFEPWAINANQLLASIAEGGAFGSVRFDSHGFYAELEEFRGYVVRAVQRRYQLAVNFQLFGSFRNGFNQNSSDIDISVFCKEATMRNLKITQIDILEAIYSHFISYQMKHYILSSEKIIGARVPVLKFKLNNTLIKQADVVMNNAHGVRNSEFFQNYSKERQIKLLVLLVKRWAKAWGLIGPKRFSSYGFVYMVLYYLIVKGKLNYVEKYLKQKKIEGRRGNRLREYQKFQSRIIPNPKLLKQIDLHDDLLQFFKFYSKGSQFLNKKTTICLMQLPPDLPDNQQEQDNEYEYSAKQYFNCHRVHSRNEKHTYLFNIHDPFDNNNPGRFLKSEQDIFFNAVQRSIHLLQSGNNQQIIKVFKIQLK